MRGLLWGLAFALVASSVSAQEAAPDPFAVPDENPPPAGDGNPFVEVPPDVPVIDPSCVPSCRAGFTCVSGECVSACNPACPAGNVCTSEGACVPEAVLNAPPPAMCSPACPAGTICSSAGTCVPPGHAYAPPPAPIVPTFDRRYAQKARSRGVLSLLSAGVSYGLLFASAAYRLRDENCDGGTGACNDGALPEVAIGTFGFLFTAIMGPIASGGGRAGRRGGGRGIPTLRAFAWLSYVLTMASGVATLAVVASDHEVPPGMLFGMAALGGTSFVLFGVDSLIAGKQATAAANETQRSLAPALSLWRESGTEALRPAFGVRVGF